MKLYIIIPVCDTHRVYVNELLVNIHSYVKVEHCVVLADNTSAQDLSPREGVEVVKMGRNIGIFAAKKRAFDFIDEKENSEVAVTFIDADDYYITPLFELPTAEIAYFDAFDCAPRAAAECKHPYTWRYIVRSQVLREAYRRIQEAAEGYSIDRLLINSCEDILLISQFSQDATFATYGLDLIEHTSNDVSATNSTNYTLSKIKWIFGDWRQLLRIAKRLPLHSQWVINIMGQCYEQYKYCMRPYLDYDEKANGDDFIRDLEIL